MGYRLDRFRRWLSRTGTDNFVGKVRSEPLQPTPLPPRCELLFGRTRTICFDGRTSSSDRPVLKRRILPSLTDSDLCMEHDTDLIRIAKTLMPARYFTSLREISQRAFSTLDEDTQAEVSAELTKICRANFILLTNEKKSASDFIFDLLLYEGCMMRSSGFALDQIKEEFLRKFSENAFPQLEVVINCVLEVLSERYIQILSSSHSLDEAKYVLRTLDPRIYLNLFANARASKDGTAIMDLNEFGQPVILRGAIVDTDRGAALSILLEIPDAEIPYSAVIQLSFNTHDFRLTKLFYPFRIVEFVEAISDFKKRDYFVERVFRFYPIWKAGFKGAGPCRFFLDPNCTSSKDALYYLDVGLTRFTDDGVAEIKVSLHERGIVHGHNEVWSQTMQIPDSGSFGEIRFVGNMQDPRVLNPFSKVSESAIRDGISEVQLAICHVSGHLFVVDLGKNPLKPNKNALYVGKYSQSDK